MTIVRVWFTGDLMTPDDTDSNAYGEPCEPGHGYTVESGFVDPDWSMSEVYANRDDVRPDEWSEDDGPLIDWIVDRIGERIGFVDSPESVNGGGGAFYAADSRQDMTTGASMRLAAHVEAAPEVLSAVRYALTFAQRPNRFLAGV